MQKVAGLTPGVGRIIGAEGSLGLPQGRAGAGLWAARVAVLAEAGSGLGVESAPFVGLEGVLV